MSREYVLDGEHEFVTKVKELTAGGVSPDRIRTFTPVPVHGLEEMLRRRPSLLKFFTLFGGLTGCATGYGFAIYTVYRWAFETSEVQWPWGLVTGGKPPLSIPAYTVIGFELTILFGALCSVLGFLLLSRMPKFMAFVPEKEYGNRFAIVVEDEERK
ncbi:MAG: DUF3341 domain-containing protein [Planctomycetes bacterium]|nr:DUF3341 domain-containing protein [Planctomycetota bacterium]